MADPKSGLKESDETNNTGQVSFEISGSGEVSEPEEPVSDGKPRITVIYPNGGQDEYFRTGSEIDLKWNSENLPEGGRLAAELYKDNSFAKTIYTRLINDGEFKWNVPDTLIFDHGSYYRIRIFYYDSKGALVAEDYSDSKFAIIDSKTPRPTLKFTASSYNLKKGETAKLFWSTTGAEDGCAVNFDQGVDTRGPNETSGEIVKPDADKVYEIVCKGAGGIINKELTIKVSGSLSTPTQPTRPIQPTATNLKMGASPSEIAKGQSATISWESTDKTSVCMVAADDQLDFVYRTNKDSKTVQPDKTTEYTVVCSGQGGAILKDSLTVTVTIAPPSKLIITAPPEISSGTRGTPVERQGLFFKGMVSNQGGTVSKPAKVGFLINFDQI